MNKRVGHRASDELNQAIRDLRSPVEDNLRQSSSDKS